LAVGSTLDPQAHLLLANKRMRVLLTVLALAVITRAVVAGAMPLTAKEVGLMLRSGYSSEAVIRELSTRHFADTFDSAVEKQLRQAGANTALLEALRSGAYQLSEAEITEANKKLAAPRESATPAVEPSKQSTPAPVNDEAAQSKALADAAPVDAVYQALKEDLVHWNQGAIAHFDSEALEHKKIFAFFIAGSWSVPCRKFTPQLVEYYNRVTPQHPEFEVIFYSADRSQYAMETYMTQNNMPWPAVSYEKVMEKGTPLKDLVHDLPCLILVQANGKVVSGGPKGEQISGPEEVLAQLDRIFAGDSATASAGPR